MKTGRKSTRHTDTAWSPFLIPNEEFQCTEDKNASKKKGKSAFIQILEMKNSTNVYLGHSAHLWMTPVDKVRQLHWWNSAKCQVAEAGWRSPLLSAGWYAAVANLPITLCTITGVHNYRCSQLQVFTVTCIHNCRWKIYDHRNYLVLNITELVQKICKCGNMQT